MNRIRRRGELGTLRRVKAKARSCAFLWTLALGMVGCSASSDGVVDAGDSGVEMRDANTGTPDASGAPDASDVAADAAGAALDAGAFGTKVTFTVYTDENCTQRPPRDSVVELDTTVACNVAPKAAISELVCLEDRITYTNHPNNDDCTAMGFFNELPVGECTAFPGPVPTWKLIERATYNCRSQP